MKCSLFTLRNFDSIAGEKSPTHCIIIITVYKKKQTANWSSGNAFVSGAVDMRDKSRADQIVNSVAYGLPLLQHFFGMSVLPQPQ